MSSLFEALTGQYSIVHTVSRSDNMVMVPSQSAGIIFIPELVSCLPGIIHAPATGLCWIGLPAELRAADNLLSTQVPVLTSGAFPFICVCVCVCVCMHVCTALTIPVSH